MDIATILTGLRENEDIMRYGYMHECIINEKYAGDRPDKFDDILSASCQKEKEDNAIVEDSFTKNSEPATVSPKKRIQNLTEYKPEDEKIYFEWDKDTDKEILSASSLSQIAERLGKILAMGFHNQDISGLAAKIKTTLGKKVLEEVLKEMDPVIPGWKKTRLSGEIPEGPRMADPEPIFDRAAFNIFDSLKLEKSEIMSMLDRIKKSLIVDHKLVDGNMKNGLEDPKNSPGLLIEKAVGEFMDELLSRAIKFASSSVNSSRQNGFAGRESASAAAVEKNHILQNMRPKDQIGLSDPDRNKTGQRRQFAGAAGSAGKISLLRTDKSDLSVSRFTTNIRTEEIAFQIAKHINSSRGGPVKEIEVRLSPESLGTIKIRVLSQDNKVNIFIKTHYVHTSEIINESIEGLKHNLIEKGLEIKELSVSTDPNDFSNKDNEKNFPAYCQQGKADSNWIKENDMAASEPEGAVFLKENYAGRPAEYGYLNIIV